jgi:hypothetical protein
MLDATTQAPSMVRSTRYMWHSRSECSGSRQLLVGVTDSVTVELWGDNWGAVGAAGAAA